MWHTTLHPLQKQVWTQCCLLCGTSVFSEPNCDPLHVLSPAANIPASCSDTSCPVQLVLLPCSPCLAQVIEAVPQDLLTAWPCPAHHLQVILWVPVGVEDDTGVSSGQVDAQPACPRAQEKDKAIRVGFAEAVDGSLAQVAAHPPVDALIGVPARDGERLEQNHSGT